MLSDIVYDHKQLQNKDDLWMAIQNAADVLMETKRNVIKDRFTRFNQRLLTLINKKGFHVPY